MPLQIVTGSAFSGKGRFVISEIERREEADGALGLVMVDYTRLYTALVPGVQSSFRDEAVSDTGAPRLVGYLAQGAIAQVAERELSGYVTTNSPRQALELAGRLEAEILVVESSVEEIADRAEDHLRQLSRSVARASRVRSVGRCRRAVLDYLRDDEQLVGKARVVRRSGAGYTVGGVKRPFDRALWERGLTPGGRATLDELVAEGVAEPTPADVMARLLRDRGRR